MHRAVIKTVVYGLSVYSDAVDEMPHVRVGECFNNKNCIS